MSNGGAGRGAGRGRTKWLLNLQRLIDQANLLPEDKREEAFRTATIAGLVGALPRVLHKATSLVLDPKSTPEEREIGFDFIAHLHESTMRGMRPDKKKALEPQAFPGFAGMQPILGVGCNGNRRTVENADVFEIPFIRKATVE